MLLLALWVIILFVLLIIIIGIVGCRILLLIIGLLDLVVWFCGLIRNYSLFWGLVGRFRHSWSCIKYISITFYFRISCWDWQYWFRNELICKRSTCYGHTSRITKEIWIINLRIWGKILKLRHLLLLLLIHYCIRQRILLLLLHCIIYFALIFIRSIFIRVRRFSIWILISLVITFLLSFAFFFIWVWKLGLSLLILSFLKIIAIEIFVIIITLIC